MNRMIQFALFISAFLLAYVSLNSYAILRMGKLFGVENKHILYALIAIVALAIPATMAIEKFFPNIITKIAYTLSTLWMGIGLFLLSSLVVYEILRIFFRIDNRIAGIVILMVVAMLSIVSIVNASLLHVEEIDLPIPGLKEDMKVVQISDMHMGTIRNSGFLKKIADKVNSLDPGIVLITGDLVDGSAPLHPSMFSSLDVIKAPIFFSTGNHETYEGVDKVYALLNETKITPLRDEVVNFDGIQVVGINFSTEKGSDLKEKLAGLKINKSKPAILMYHTPEGMEHAKEAGIDLQLSGHTHGGQIFPFNFVVKLVHDHVRGLYDFDGMKLYVSPGTGTWGPYMRLGSRNEITLFRLRKA